MASSHTAHIITPAQAIGRRAVLAGLAVASAAGTAVAAVPDEVEAAVNAWREWRQLEMEHKALTPKMHATYKTLPNDVNMPGVVVFDQWHMSEDGIDRACSNAPSWMETAVPAIREAAKRELMAAYQRCEVEQERCGYTAMEKRSDEIMELQRELIDRIEGSDSTHPAVIAAKIDMSLSEGNTKAMLGDCPWVPLTTILRSLLPHLPADMAAALAPAAEHRGTIGELFGLPREE